MRNFAPTFRLVSRDQNDQIRKLLDGVEKIDESQRDEQDEIIVGVQLSGNDLLRPLRSHRGLYAVV